MVRLPTSRSLVDNKDSHCVLPARGSKASVRTLPGLYICQKGKVNSANIYDHKKPQIMIIDIDCRVKESEMGGGPVFSCEAKSGSNQILVEGSSISVTESSSWR